MTSSLDSQALIHLASTHIESILLHSIPISEKQSVVIVKDELSDLAKILTKAYQKVLPKAEILDFYQLSQPDFLARLHELQSGDLVVLIQTSSFRLDAFRLRVELFHRGLKVIEHPHLGRFIDQELLYYIDSLSYDPDYYVSVGHSLKNRMDVAKTISINSGDKALIIEEGLESAKLNIGDYRHLTNVGGQFPIGEVFSEAKDLTKVNGAIVIFAFCDNDFQLNIPNEPITLSIVSGRVREVKNATPAFNAVLEKIKHDENEIWVREIGFGLNRAFSETKIVKDVGAYERMCGVHISLGAKHTVFKKPLFKRGTTWHHVDVFVVSPKVYIDHDLAFENGYWIV